MNKQLLGFLLLSAPALSQNGREACVTATVIPAIPYQAIGSTSGANDDYLASCQDIGTYEVGFQPTYLAELEKFKPWISDRLDWLDLSMPGTCPDVGIEESPSKVPYFAAYPNPKDGELNFYAEGAIFELILRDLSGKEIARFDGNGKQLIALNLNLLPGMYVARVELANGILVQTKFTHL